MPPLAASHNITEILRPLQWLVVALIFLFFLRVIRAVWVEVRPAGPRATRAERRREAAGAPVAGGPPAAPGPPGRRRRRQLYLEVLEPPEHRGEVFGLDTDGELTVGRSPGCAIATSYDVYSSTLHARLYRRGEQLWIEDLGSTNGTFVNSERIVRPTRLGRGDLVQVGATVFEVAR